MKSNLLEPTRIGDLTLSNRIALAPMTRTRAEADGTPSDLMAEYYTQRASAGLVIAEATGVEPFPDDLSSRRSDLPPTESLAGQTPPFWID